MDFPNMLSAQKEVKLCNDLLMPIIGLGTFKIRGFDLVYRTIKCALTCGYRAFDTASVYRNEEDIAKALKELLPQFGLKREDIFLTSKLGTKDQGKYKCKEACLASLRKLDTEYLDLFLIHWPGVQKVAPSDEKNRLLRKESWQDLEQLHKQGVLRAIGVSNYTKRHLAELLEYCQVTPAVLQIEHHPHLVQRELVALCRERGVHFQAYSSLGTSTEDNKLLSDPVVVSIAAARHRTSAQILLRWAVQQGIGVIPKSTNEGHIRENMEIFDFELSDSEMNALNSMGTHAHYCWDPTKVT